MEVNFWHSNLFQTLVMVLSVIITIFTALYNIHSHTKKELRNAVMILMLQIKDIEKNIEYLLSEGLSNGAIQETSIHYSTVIFEENNWNKYSHCIVGNISQEAFEMIDNFFKVAQRIREQQIYIKQKSLMATDNKAMYYYSAMYNKLVIEKGSEETVESLKDRFNKINIPPYIPVESFLGLEKTLKQYHKITDGVAYNELKTIAKKNNG